MKACELFDNAEGFENIQISGIFEDSRKIIQGGVFVCIVGENDDGHRYADRAEKLGAAIVVASSEVNVNIPVVYVKDTKKALALLAQKFYHHPEKKLKLIGVTGTNGKTTVTFLIKSILEAAGKKTGIIGTNKCYIGNKKLNFETDEPTTPNSIELSRIFSKMVEEDAEYVVMEVSSHALALSRVYGLNFEVGVFTNLTRDHLDFHKDMDEYLNVKAKLFEKCDVSVINIDTAMGIKMAQKCRGKVVTLGVHYADITASAITLGKDFVEFVAEEKDERHLMKLKIPGRFSVYNALCAVAASRVLKIPYPVIAAGLAGAGTVRGRVELVPTQTPYRVFIDYAHTPDGLKNILQTAKGFTRGKVIAVFGCGGDRDRTKRPIMGEIAGNLADFSVITSDNPRTENPVEIIEEIKKGIAKTNGEYIIVVNRKEAIEYALSVAKEDDTVLLCGKGQEDYQIIGKTKYHFDEREVVEEILKKTAAV